MPWKCLPMPKQPSHPCLSHQTDSFAALRQDLRSFGVDLKLDSRSCLNTVLAYICMCYNLHSSFKDTKRSPKAILIGRDVEMQTSLFGSLVLAEIPNSLVNKAFSRFEKSCYLRPEFASLGHLCVTVLNGEECIFISKSIKFLTPLSWDCSLAPKFLTPLSWDCSLAPSFLVGVLNPQSHQGEMGEKRNQLILRPIHLAMHNLPKPRAGPFRPVPNFVLSHP